MKEPGRVLFPFNSHNHKVSFCCAFYAFIFVSAVELSRSFSGIPVVHLIAKVNNMSASTGDYEVSIKFNNEHIPDSPFIVPIATLSDEARRLTVTSLQVQLALTCAHVLPFKLVLLTFLHFFCNIQRKHLHMQKSKSMCEQLFISPSDSTLSLKCN